MLLFFPGYNKTYWNENPSTLIHQWWDGELMICNQDDLSKVAFDGPV